MSFEAVILLSVPKQTSLTDLTENVSHFGDNPLLKLPKIQNQHNDLLLRWHTAILPFCHKTQQEAKVIGKDCNEPLPLTIGEWKPHQYNVSWVRRTLTQTGRQSILPCLHIMSAWQTDWQIPTLRNHQSPLSTFHVFECHRVLSAPHSLN